MKTWSNSSITRHGIDFSSEKLALFASFYSSLSRKYYSLICTYDIQINNDFLFYFLTKCNKLQFDEHVLRLKLLTFY